MSHLLGAACWAADRGWLVFPLAGKVPRTGRGVLDATRDYAQLDGWWGRWPGAGIGLACGPSSGVWVLDVDGPTGRESLAALEATHGPLPPTVRALTPRGAHHYFRWVSGVRNSASSDRLGAGLDTRGAGGYVVMPPSIHPSGDPYRWDPDAHPEKITVADAPAWLLELVRPPPNPDPEPRSSPLPKTGPREQWGDQEDREARYLQAALEAELHAVAHAPEGTRNYQLNRSAWSLARFVVDGRLTEGAVRTALAAAATHAGLGSKEIERTLDSAFGKRGKAA